MPLWMGSRGGSLPVARSSRARRRLVSSSELRRQSRAVEGADVFHGGALGLVGVAVVAARDEIAVGIAAEVGVRDDVVEEGSSWD